MRYSFAHLSDLHIGRAGAADEAAALVDELVSLGLDHVVVTGDVTEHGSAAELRVFEALFAPLKRRLTAVPGNHDRLGTGQAMQLSRGRTWTEHGAGLHLVCLDTTAPHNRSLITGHGVLDGQQITAVERALAHAPVPLLRLVLMHHHPVPMPEDNFAERLAGWLGRPYARELSRGRELIARVAGSCHLILHGHRHRPSLLSVDGPGRAPLQLANAGSSTELLTFRVYEHDGREIHSHQLMTLRQGARPSVARAA